MNRNGVELTMHVLYTLLCLSEFLNKIILILSILDFPNRMTISDPFPRPPGLRENVPPKTVLLPSPAAEEPHGLSLAYPKNAILQQKQLTSNTDVREPLSVQG